jgi:hypothetical protein
MLFPRLTKKAALRLQYRQPGQAGIEFREKISHRAPF